MRRTLVVLIAALAVIPSAAAWTWPAEGVVLQPFSFDRQFPKDAGQHRGIDVAGALGAVVRAPAAGIVSFAGSVPTNGKCVTIETADGWSVTLTHLGSIAVTKGATVAEGDGVGTIGPSDEPGIGEPHVHLGIRWSVDEYGYVDPIGTLPARAGASPSATPTPVAPDSTRPEPAPAPAVLPSDVASTAAAIASPSVDPPRPGGAGPSESSIEPSGPSGSPVPPAPVNPTETAVDQAPAEAVSTPAAKLAGTVPPAEPSSLAATPTPTATEAPVVQPRASASRAVEAGAPQPRRIQVPVASPVVLSRPAVRERSMPVQLGSTTSPLEPLSATETDGKLLEARPARPSDAAASPVAAPAAVAPDGGPASDPPLSVPSVVAVTGVASPVSAPASVIPARSAGRAVPAVRAEIEAPPSAPARPATVRGEAAPNDTARPKSDGARGEQRLSRKYRARG